MEEKKSDLDFDETKLIKELVTYNSPIGNNNISGKLKIRRRSSLLISTRINNIIPEEQQEQKDM